MQLRHWLNEKIKVKQDAHLLMLKDFPRLVAARHRERRGWGGWSSTLAIHRI